MTSSVDGSDPDVARARLFPSRASALGLAGLVALVLAAHLFVLFAEPTPRLWGDEPEYAGLVRELAERGETGLLPGSLPFEHRPLFGVQLVACLRSLFGQASPYRIATLLNLSLLPLLLVAVYVQARLLQLRWPAALLAATLLGLSPWFGFHVHSLWPEVLHATLFAAVLTGLLSHLRSGQLGSLALAGVGSAFALFTKGVLGVFVPLFALLLFAAAWRRADRPGLRALLPPAVYLAALLLVLTPQLVHNQRAGHGWRLAANRWWNLEIGLTSRPPELTVGDVNQRYLGAAATPKEREGLARRRTLEYVQERGVLDVARAQVGRLGQLFVQRLSAFEMSLLKMERWGAEPPGWIAALRLPGRVHWYALLALALVGLARSLRAGSGWVLVSLFTLGFLGALLAVPLKVRFAMPLVPVLCLLAASAVEGLWLRGRPREPAR